jgi:hypothetical protein
MLYRWSKRWLKAEREQSERPADPVAALQAHLDRMRDLEQIVQKLQRGGLTTVDEISAVEFYKSEAELWLLQAKTAKKKP